MTLLIKNGRVIDPATRTDKQMDILVEDDRIAKRAEKIDTKADKTINAKGCYVMPGFIDMHVHLRDPGQEEKPGGGARRIHHDPCDAEHKAGSG